MQEDNKSKGLLCFLKFESIFFRVGYNFRDQNQLERPLTSTTSKGLSDDLKKLSWDNKYQE